MPACLGASGAQPDRWLCIFSKYPAHAGGSTAGMAYACYIVSTGELLVIIDGPAEARSFAAMSRHPLLAALTQAPDPRRGISCGLVAEQWIPRAAQACTCTCALCSVGPCDSRGRACCARTRPHIAPTCMPMCAGCQPVSILHANVCRVSANFHMARSQVTGSQLYQDWLQRLPGKQVTPCEAGAYELS